MPNLSRTPVTTRVTPDIKMEIQAQAERQGLTVSDILETIVNKHCSGVSDNDPTLKEKCRILSLQLQEAREKIEELENELESGDSQGNDNLLQLRTIMNERHQVQMKNASLQSELQSAYADCQKLTAKLSRLPDLIQFFKKSKSEKAQRFWEMVADLILSDEDAYNKLSGFHHDDLVLHIFSLQGHQHADRKSLKELEFSEKLGLWGGKTEFFMLERIWEGSHNALYEIISLNSSEEYGKQQA